MEDEAEKTQDYLDGSKDRELELKLKIRKLEERVDVMVSPSKLKEKEIEREDKEIQTDDVQFYTAGASEHNSKSAKGEQLQGVASRNSMLSEHKE